MENKTIKDIIDKIIGEDKYLQAAKKLGITRAYMSAIILGKREINPNMFNKIKEAYNVSEELSNELLIALYRNNSTKFINKYINN